MTIPADKSRTPSTTPTQTPRQGWGTRSHNTISFDPEYTVGARNAVQVCLRVQPNEKVCVITDEATLEIAAAIVHELDELGLPFRRFDPAHDANAPRGFEGALPVT